MVTVYFDGDCGLCGRFVGFLKRHDRRGTLHFQPLEGASDTVIVRDSTGTTLTRSQAVFKAIGEMGQPWRTLAFVARLVPTRLADSVYVWVAARRSGICRT